MHVPYLKKVGNQNGDRFCVHCKRTAILGTGVRERPQGGGHVITKSSVDKSNRTRITTPSIVRPHSGPWGDGVHKIGHHNSVLSDVAAVSIDNITTELVKKVAPNI